MAIEFKPGVYYLGIWFVTFNKMDVLGAAWKEEKPGADWEVTWRFRYYVNEGKDSAWDHEDKKHWYGATINGDTPEDEVFEKFGSMFHMMNAMHPESLNKLSEKKIQGDYMKAVNWLRKQPWSQVKAGAAAEAWEKESEERAQANAAVASAEKEAGWDKDKGK
jgi:hypothetical protein